MAENNKKEEFLYDKQNFLLMIVGLVIIAIGFALMVGGAPADGKDFIKEEVYSFRRITLAPIVVLIGFAVEVYAIMKKPND